MTIYIIADGQLTEITAPIIEPEPDEDNYAEWWNWLTVLPV